MKNYITLIVCMFFFKYSYAQEYYHITAKSGLNVRSSPNLTSKKVAKIPFGVVVEKLEDTDKELVITDNGKEIKGTWVKIEYNNYGYLVNEEKEQFSREGFVFDGFIKPMKNKNLNIEIEKIQKSEFFNLKNDFYFKAKEFRKIEDLDSIKALLKNRVKWQKWGAGTDYEDEEDEGTVVKYFITENKQKLVFDTRDSETGFAKGYSGYYPEEEILVLEGGHSSDMCYSIKNGGETRTVGNPKYIISSPKNTYRLNGYFPGQECSEYFFQKNVRGNFEYLKEFDLWRDYGICYFKEFYWINETEFVFTESYDNKFEKYYKGKIKTIH